MVQFPPIDMATAQPTPRFIGDEEPKRLARSALKNLACYDGSHDYAYCWGYTIFRTVYTPGSDEAFSKAIERLAIYAKSFTQDEATPPRLGVARDPRPNEDLWSRYYNEIVQDEQTLAGASENKVGEIFDEWIRHNRRPPTATSRHELNSRFSFCLMLDQESVDNILALPENPRSPECFRVTKAGKSWVKVITDSMRSEAQGGDGRWWLRVGVTDYLWSLWFSPSDSDICLEELGWEEDGVQNLWGSPDTWYKDVFEEAIRKNQRQPHLSYQETLE